MLARRGGLTIGLKRIFGALATLAGLVRSALAFRQVLTTGELLWVSL
jgi:hypothetical protein